MGTEPCKNITLLLSQAAAVVAAAAVFSTVAPAATMSVGDVSLRFCGLSLGGAV